MFKPQISGSEKSRLDILAQPKVNYLKYPDRPSVYWQDKPNMSFSSGLSERQEELAKPKQVNNMFIQDRPSPIWPVKSSALVVVPSPRVEELAQAKPVSQYWVEDRSAYSVVTEGAKKAFASARVAELAMPKNCMDRSVPSTPNSMEEEEESPTSKNMVACTARIEALAVSKTEHPHFQHDLPVQRAVSASALHSQASDRVCQLAKARIRKSLFEGYDPYRISPAAKHVEASPRIIELCSAPARRQRQKRV
ncbi:sperm microtubule associated protein 2 [Hyperolius riggenbachi]|uniref:sperm microtubule associated protein 2 n=1 Tax=Hyperolius riggenbachi TaxID=752182 RepID=UPI0035A2B343